jgi:hypothetical protein
MVIIKRENPCNQPVGYFARLHSIMGGTIFGRMDGHFLSCQCPTQCAALLHMHMGKSSMIIRTSTSDHVKIVATP